MSVSLQHTLAKLAAFDTPTIANVIELFGIVPRNRGYMDSRIRSAFPDLPPMIGFAATACFRADEPPANGVAGTTIEHQLDQFSELEGPAIVVFQDLDDPSVGATFGEGMCTIYKAFGSAGLITSGSGRDLRQIRALEYPVFTNGTVCAHGYNQVLQVGAPVRVGGLTVHPGDLLHGDANGVVKIPLRIAAEIADVASEFLAVEQIILRLGRDGTTVSRAEIAAARKEFSLGLTQLKQRLQANTVNA